MSDVRTIDPDTLITVHGGEGEGPNRTQAEGNLKVNTPAFTVEGQGKYSTARTDYAACLDALKGRTPEEIAKTCGVPGKTQ